MYIFANCQTKKIRGNRRAPLCLQYQYLKHKTETLVQNPYICSRTPPHNIIWSFSFANVFFLGGGDNRGRKDKRGKRFPLGIALMITQIQMLISCWHSRRCSSRQDRCIDFQHMCKRDYLNKANLKHKLLQMKTGTQLMQKESPKNPGKPWR